MLATLAITVSCGKVFPDDRENHLPDDNIYLDVSSLKQDIPASDGQYQIVIIKGGKGKSPADVTVSIDQNVLKEYNEANGASYQMTPSNIIDDFSSTTVHFDAKDTRSVVTITWNVAALTAYLSVGKYVVPVSISCEGLEMVEGKTKILIHPTL